MNTFVLYLWRKKENLNVILLLYIVPTELLKYLNVLRDFAKFICLFCFKMENADSAKWQQFVAQHFEANN
jgi:hypothetical protein